MEQIGPKDKWDLHQYNSLSIVDIIELRVTDLSQQHCSLHYGFYYIQELQLLLLILSNKNTEHGDNWRLIYTQHATMTMICDPRNTRKRHTGTDRPTRCVRLEEQIDTETPSGGWESLPRSDDLQQQTRHHQHQQQHQRSKGREVVEETETGSGGGLVAATCESNISTL